MMADHFYQAVSVSQKNKLKTTHIFRAHCTLILVGSSRIHVVSFSNVACCIVIHLQRRQMTVGVCPIVAFLRNASFPVTLTCKKQISRRMGNRFVHDLLAW
jgi:hypothetical protein